MRTVRRRARAGRFVRHLAVLSVVSGIGAGAALSAQDPPGDAGEGARAAQQAPAVDPALFQDLHYRSIGPHRGGRVTAVEGIRSQPSTFFMGATGGGVWKTDDYGQTWNNVSDGFFRTGSIGAIRVAASDPNRVYVGTGSDGIRSNVIAGKGVYASSDGGGTWTHVGLEDAGQIGRMAVHPEDPDTVYVGAIGNPFRAGGQRGVYKTTDGGRSWERVLAISDQVGVYGLVMKPDDPDTLYASAWRAERKPWTIISGNRVQDGAGIYKSTDGGESWRKVQTGLPQDLMGKTDIAVSPADPGRVYALVEAPEPEEGLYRSDDEGESWRLVNGDDELMERPFYYTNLDVDPTNADVVWALSVGFYKSTDGGQTFEERDTPHTDNHDMWINPDDPRVFIEGNDGGANVTLNDGRTWSTQHNQQTAELYEVDVDDRFPYWACAGQQDNTAICVPSLPPGRHNATGPGTGWWRSVAGCETGPAVPKPGDPTKVYGNCKGEFSVYDYDTGQERNYWARPYFMYGHAARDLPNRFQRNAPIEVSPHDPDVVFHASQYVYRTRTDGRRWTRISDDLTATPPGTQGISGEPITRDITGEEFYSAVYAIEESPVRQGVIWVGSNDGPFHVSRNGGRTWDEITPEGLPPGGRVQSIEPSPHDAGTAYYAVYRYLLGDFRPYLYRTEDFGRSWTLLTDGRNGIAADDPTRVVREDPEREGLLYAGTDSGMFVSFDDGARWQSLQLDLPVAAVTDIELTQDDLVLSTMGRGFWILDDPAPLRQIRDAASSGVHLYEPTAAYRMRYPANEAQPGEPEYPPPGAYLDYVLPEGTTGPVTLEILDASGDTVRRFSSAPAGDAPAPPDEPGALPPLEGAGTPQLEAGPGMHRFRWDLAHAGAWDADAERSGRSGPLALPGTYRARLTAGGVTRTQAFEVRIDPRVAESGVTQRDLAEQLGLNLDLRDALSEVRIAIARIGRAQDALEGDASPEAETARQALAELRSGIETDPDEPHYPQRMLDDQIAYLYGMTTAADQELGRDAFARHRQIRRQLDRAVAELEEILQDCGATCAA